MIYLIADSPVLLRALAERFALASAPASGPERTTAGSPALYRGEDLRLAETDHNGPRAAARLGFLLGRAVAAEFTRPALILAATVTNLQHPRLVTDIRRGGERYSAAPLRDSSLEPISLRVLPDAPPSGEESAATDLAAAQARFTARTEEIPSTSLMLWWLIAAARPFLRAEDVVTVVTPKPLARGLEESLQGITEVIDLLRRRAAGGPE